MFMAILSVQFGGAFAATLIPHVGALGTVALRMSLAALVLAPIVRPHVKGHSRADWMRVLALTIALAGMNTVFYFSLERLPLGVAVTAEFLGPLGMAALGSRSLRDWLEPRGINVVTPVDGVDGSVTGHPGGANTIEGIGPRPTGREEVVGLGDAQQVTGTVLGKLLSTPRHDSSQIGFLDGAANAEPVEAVTVDLHACQIPASPTTQIFVLGSLDDTKKGLVRLAAAHLGETTMFGQAALSPPPGALQGFFLISAGVHKGGQLVEGEHDVGAEVVLDAHRHLGSETM